MKTYRVSWTIEVDADNPIDAARQAANMMPNGRSWPNMGSTATEFDVTDIATGERIGVNIAKRGTNGI